MRSKAIHFFFGKYMYLTFLFSHVYLYKMVIFLIIDLEFSVLYYTGRILIL